MKLKLIKIIKETENTKSLRFSRDKSFNFKSGQFIVFILKDKEGEFRRAYSISTSPDEKEFFEITIKETPNGRASNIFLKEAKINDEFEALGPYGTFIYNNEDVKNIIHISAGSGIAPIRSIIYYILKNKPEIKQTLLFSNKTEKDIIYKEEFEKLPIENVFTLTRETHNKHRNGRISKDLLKNYIKDSALYFICGPPLFVDSMVNELKDLNVKQEQIRTERYD